MVSYVSALPLHPFYSRNYLMRQKTIASILPLALILSLLPFAAFATNEQPSVKTPPQPKSALFIGNSFTYYNNSLHMHVLNITKSASRKQGRTNQEDTFYTKAMTISGGYLKDHALGAKGMIQDFTNGKKPGPWDVVVVQGYSRGPLTKETAPLISKQWAKDRQLDPRCGIADRALHDLGVPRPPGNDGASRQSLYGPWQRTRRVGRPGWARL